MWTIMDTLLIHRLFTLTLLAVCLGERGAQQGIRRNVVLAVLDDAGWNDLGSPTKPFLTHLFDRSGVRLTAHYTQPQCAPARFALATSKFPLRYGLQGVNIWPNHDTALPLTETMLASRFRAAGWQLPWASGTWGTP